MNIKDLFILGAVFVALLVPAGAYAEHKSAVSGQVVNSDDPSISQGSECNGAAHYHGTLNGVGDPDPHGCGHGVVTLIAHGDGDGETIPATPATKNVFQRAGDAIYDFFTNLFSEETEETIGNVVDVAAEANGILPPNQTAEIVDIVKDATPSIMENVDNIDAYRESVPEGEDTLDLYKNLDNVSENPTISERFFKWFNSLVN